MNAPEGPDLTRLLRRWAEGDVQAQHALAEQVYETLRQMAHSLLSRERPGHTLQATALVHEAYLKLVDGAKVDWRDRVHFLAVAARVMRRVLVDAGRRRSADKRTLPPSLTTSLGTVEPRDVDIIDLEEALTRLEALNARQARVVELRCFAGLTVPEIAGVMELSVPTVNRAWRAACAWLKGELDVA